MTSFRITPLGDFRGARQERSPKRRLEGVRERARGFRERLMAEPQVPYYRSFDLVRVPYPAHYALLNAYHFGFLNAVKTPTPLIHIANRMTVVQFEGEGGLKTLLIGPTDSQGAEKTPFFERMRAGLKPMQERLQRFLAPQLNRVEACLAEIGLSPEDIDYLSFDHLHTQDLRRWLGTGDQPGYFPRARLIVSPEEWATVLDPLPSQAEWYCPNGGEGVAEHRLLWLDEDLWLGRGVALLRTPGHTMGNHSFAVRTSEGILVTSENGVGPDAYAPLASEIPGVRDFARATGMEVILNGNSLESGIDQYISMVMEKEIAGPSERFPNFPNLRCSSELTAYWGFPGIRPTAAFGAVSLGSLQKRLAVEARS